MTTAVADNQALFEPKITKHIGADVAAAAGTKLIFELSQINHCPYLESVDTILSTQTLEHVPDFNFYLAECQRLARPGGVLISPPHGSGGISEALMTIGDLLGMGSGMSFSPWFEARSIMVCGGICVDRATFRNHLVEHGIRRKFLIRTVNRGATVGPE